VETIIKFNCQVDNTLPFTELLPFQGNLKTSSDDEIKNLATSLLMDGQITPYLIWHKPCPDGEDPTVWHSAQPHYVIDGHRRLLAVQYISLTQPEVLKQEFPVLIIIAPDSETAKNQLLQICSTYGKITPKGLATFLADAPKIKIEKMGLKVKLQKIKTNAGPAPKSLSDNYTVMRIRVEKCNVPEVTKLLSDCSFIEVL